MKRLLPSSAVLGVALVLAATAGAAGAKLVDSAGIKDESIRSVDIKNGTLATSDLSAPAIQQLRGAQGPTGPAGPQGPPGAGAAAPDVMTWSFGFTEDGGSGKQAGTNVSRSLDKSTQSLPPRALLSGVKIEIDDKALRAGCSDYFLTIGPRAGDAFVPAVAEVGQLRTEDRLGVAIVEGDAAQRQMAVVAYCTGPDYRERVMPSFSGKVTFTVTQQATSPSRALE